MKPTGILFFPAFDWAISPTHPEREERLLYTRDQLFEEGIMDLPNIKEYQSRMATEKDISRTHFCVPDVESRVTKAHLVSAGSTLVLADAFMQKEVKNAFAIIRPPGHHAMTVSHGNRGFCDINNEAIMVEYIRQNYGLEKIAIVDTDVHHGDGSQEIFYHDPNVLFISFHQDGRTLYPGSGFMDELGGPLAYGTTINIPLAPGTGDYGIHYILDNLVLPILEEFKPELIINSAGQDNHFSDPLANMNFTAQGYAILNQKLAPDIAVLEGGYSVETALPYVNMGIIMAMAGIDFSNLKEPGYKRESQNAAAQEIDSLNRIVKTQLNNFRLREEKVGENRKTGKTFFSYNRNIFYDTDYIHEEQKLNLRLCQNCGGYRSLSSSARQRDGAYYKIYAVNIPIYGCEKCQSEGLELYRQMTESGKYDYVYLQDHPRDKFHSFNIKRLQEKVY
ncbi:MAG: histone deacetylase [Syntrophomonadaceae bacterium]|jgi:acetoin utilization deacetylase AcuC-like enzyme|nr:histone deacetylase [Syntrophomonadaceae bacterium]